MGRLGQTKGWVEFDGKKYRAKELEALIRSDRDVYTRLLSLFTEEVLEAQSV